MNERRRSGRVATSLPVWLKDAQGGERTQTLDVSAHGISVRSDRARPSRQYMELELTLPGDEQLAVTAMVARVSNDVSGLELFAMDSETRRRWQAFLRELSRTRATLRSGVARPADAQTPRASPVGRLNLLRVAESRSEASQQEKRRQRTDELRSTSDALTTDDDREETDEPTNVELHHASPSFLVKPRDLGRLWTFYRGELARGCVRLASPVAQAPGSSVEVLVVHPQSEAEWSLRGRITSQRPGRAGQQLLEVSLIGIDTGARAAFRSFLATGRAPSNVPRAETRAPVPERTPSRPDRLPSVVVDLSDLEETSASWHALDEEETCVLDRPTGTKMGTIAQALDPSSEGTRFFACVEELEDLVELDASEIEEVPSVDLHADEVAMGPYEEEPGTPVEVSDLLDERSASEPAQPSEPSVHERTERLPIDGDRPEALVGLGRYDLPPATRDLPPVDTHSTRDEGHSGEAKRPLASPRSARSAALDEDSGVVFGHEATARCDSLIEDVQPDPESAEGDDDFPHEVSSASFQVPAPSSSSEDGLFASFFREADEDKRNEVGRFPPPPPPAEASEVIRAKPMPPGFSGKYPKGRPKNADSVVVTAAHGNEGRNGAPEEHGHPPVPVGGLRLVPPPPATPGSFFEAEETAAPETAVPTRPSPRARRRAADERADRVVQPRSSAGTNPSLDRDIALARARVVRNPEDPEATAALAELLFHRGRRDTVEEAVRVYERLLILRPEHREAHVRLSELHARAGRYGRASEHLRSADHLGQPVDPDLRSVVQRGLRHQ